MRNFTYACPTKIIFGKDEVKKIENEIGKNERVLLIYGGGSIKKNGVYDEVMTALKGHFVLEFGGVQANPDFDTCLEIAKFARENEITFLLAVGGGSVIDATKFVAHIVYESGNEWEILMGKMPKKALPLGCVLTMAATGTEMNANSVISRRSTQEKRSFHSPFCFPKFSVVDPKFNFTLPKNQTINGIVDAFVHVLEQYATYEVNSPLQDLWAIGILRVLIDESKKVLENENDYEARANISWCATCALNHWIGLGVVQDWAIHAIGHELTAFYGLDHAQSLAIVLPSRYKNSLNQKKQKLAKLARECFFMQGDDENLALACVDKIEEFFISLGIGTRLKDYGIDNKEAAKKISQRFKDRGRKYGEMGEVDNKMCEKILLEC